MKRTFLPIKDYPVYNDAVDRYMMASKVFNQGSERIPNFTTIFFDRKNIEAYILELEGDPETGKLIKAGEVMPSQILVEKSRLNEIQKQYEKYKYERVQQGFEEPEQMPLELLNEWYLTHARLTICESELQECKKHLSEFTDEVDEVEEAKILQWGLRCFGKLRNNQLEKIDNQKCSQTDEGFIIIDDIRSPYDGMAVSDYRKLAKQWNLDRANADRQRLLRLQSDARSKGERIPQALPVKSMHRVNLNSLPAWPSDIPNHLINSDSESIATK